MQLRCLSGWGEDVSGEVLERVEFKLHRSFQNNRIGGVFLASRLFLAELAVVFIGVMDLILCNFVFMKRL